MALGFVSFTPGCSREKEAIFHARVQEALERRRGDEIRNPDTDFLFYQEKLRFIQSQRLPLSPTHSSVGTAGKALKSCTQWLRNHSMPLIGATLLLVSAIAVRNFAADS